ncbi:putative Carbonyl reductase family member 4 [Seiridium cardinale]
MAAAIKNSPQPYSVSGKTAVVTGAGSGINLAFASILLSRNCNVVLADISLRPEAVHLIEKYGDDDKTPRALFVKTDVTSWADLSHLFDVTTATFGDFDIVCPGAGIYEPHSSNFWHPPGSSKSRDSAEGNRYAIIDINVTHPIRTTQLAISHWLHPRPSPDGQSKTAKVSKSNPKRVVHISSVAGQMPNLNAPIYGASKFAITGFVRCLASLEDSIGVRVNAVAPGLVRTPLWTEHPEKLQFLDSSQDAWITQEEVASAMLRCIEDPDLVSGTILEVGRDTSRQVKTVNDPGPDRSPQYGLVASNAGKGVDEILGWLLDENVWGDAGASRADRSKL